MVFFSYKVEPKISMRERNSLYEYITICVDDLDIVAEQPTNITHTMIHECEFKPKGTGPITYYL